MTTVTKCNQFSSKEYFIFFLSLFSFVIDVKHFALTCLLIIGLCQMMDWWIISYYCYRVVIFMILPCHRSESLHKFKAICKKITLGLLNCKKLNFFHPIVICLSGLTLISYNGIIFWIECACVCMKTTKLCNSMTVCSTISRNKTIKDEIIAWCSNCCTFCVSH